MLMEHILIGVILGFLGLCMGSYAGATVWRLRARQLVEDKADGEKVDSTEYKKLLPLTQSTFTNDRSRCLHCGHTLAWYDLLPLASWISTKGKCRYCGKKIGTFEPLMEIGTATVFVAAYVLWPHSLVATLPVIEFGLWIAAAILLVILFAYDLKWFLLPNRAMFPLIGMGVLSFIVQLLATTDVIAIVTSTAGGVGILSGLYLLLWLVSKGQWIGFGDVKLGLALALLLADWRLAFITLFAANLVGCLIVIPGLLSGKMTRKTHVPFGPLLIIGFVIASLFGQSIIQWYMASFLLF